MRLKDMYNVSLKDKYEYGHRRFYDILDEIAQLHNDKNRDYATKENPMGNFTRVAEICKRYNLITPGNEALKVAIIYKLKQLDAALKLIGSNTEGRVEGVPERLKDIGVYSLIEMILYEEEK